MRMSGKEEGFDEDHQCWNIEIMAVVDVVANGKVPVKLIADGLQIEAVAFPMIARITLTAYPKEPHKADPT